MAEQPRADVHVPHHVLGAENVSSFFPMEYTYRNNYLAHTGVNYNVYLLLHRVVLFYYMVLERYYTHELHK